MSNERIYLHLQVTKNDGSIFDILIDKNAFEEDQADIEEYVAGGVSSIEQESEITMTGKTVDILPEVIVSE